MTEIDQPKPTSTRQARAPQSRTPGPDHPAEEWPKIFRVLQYVEFWLVVFIATFAALLTIYLALWTLFGWLPDVHARLVVVIKGLNEVWKVAVLILIPLFFRPVFKFLFYLRNGPLGTKSELPSTSPAPGEYHGTEP